MATLLKTDGSSEEVQPKNGRDFMLKELQGFVGGYIEFIRLGKFMMVINEEGLLQGLQYNHQATVKVRDMGLGHQRTTIVGNALLCKLSEVQ